MAKNKPKIKNEVLPPRYRVNHLDDRIKIYLGDGSSFMFYGKLRTFTYSVYENNIYYTTHIVPDYTNINSEEELFQQECICDTPMNFRTLVQIQKTLIHHYYQCLFPSKLELCNQKTNYIVDVSYTDELLM